MTERAVHVPDVMQPPAPCPGCGNPDRLFTPNARRAPYDSPVVYEPAWQCTRCGRLDFIAPPEQPPGTVAATGPSR